ncbi:MAG: phosphoglycolate phosphatase [Methylotenera sp.]|nr:MAG: phosphoglycolate phosphatase [Methylotenera sp.]
MKFKVKAVMIDLDGTLIHTAPEIARAANVMLAALNLPNLTPKKVEKFIGEGAATLIARCLTQQLNAEPTQELLTTAKPLFFDAYAQIVAESKPYPQVTQALQLFKKMGLKLACITNKPTAFTIPLLEKSGLLPYFDVVVAGDTLQRKKPDPDQIFFVCEKFSILQSDAVLIGDSKTDIAAARSAGCRIFAVPYGYNQGYSIDIDTVDALIPQLIDAIDLIATD